MNTPRDSRIDNLKGFLIVLVVLGHALQELPRQNGWRGPGKWTAIYCLIGMIHMPAFAFVSGYLSSVRKTVLDHTREILLLYLLAQALWCVFLVALSVSGSPRPGPGQWLCTLPGLGLWYLLSLFFWRLSIPLLHAVRRPWIGMLFVIAFGALIGLNNSISEEMTLSRVFAFAPFFAAGFWSRRESSHLISRENAGMDWLLPTLALPASAWVFYEAYHVGSPGTELEFAL